MAVRYSPFGISNFSAPHELEKIDLRQWSIQYEKVASAFPWKGLCFPVKNTFHSLWTEKVGAFPGNLVSAQDSLWNVIASTTLKIRVAVVTETAVGSYRFRGHLLRERSVPACGRRVPTVATA